VESPRALSAGLTFAAAVAMFALGGNWLDDRLGTQPLCILLGMLLGMVGGTLHLLRVLAPATLPFRQKKKDDDSSK
jgi:F0F1-type ATP synthase assembly protein I